MNDRTYLLIALLILAAADIALMVIFTINRKALGCRNSPTAFPMQLAEYYTKAKIGRDTLIQSKEER
jgi:hypothetical protein